MAVGRLDDLAPLGEWVSPFIRCAAKPFSASWGTIAAQSIQKIPLLSRQAPGGAPYGLSRARVIPLLCRSPKS